VLRISLRPRKNRAVALAWRARVELGLVVDVLDDGLAELGFGQALLHAGQRVADDIAGREGRAFELGLSGKPSEPLPLLSCLKFDGTQGATTEKRMRVLPESDGEAC
jgi:hypothetical protein